MVKNQEIEIIMSKLLRVWMYIKTRKLRSVVILFFLCILFGSTYFSFEYGYMFHPQPGFLLEAIFQICLPMNGIITLSFSLIMTGPAGDIYGIFRLSRIFKELGSDFLSHRRSAGKVGLSPWDEYFERKT